MDLEQSSSSFDCSSDSTFCCNDIFRSIVPADPLNQADRVPVLVSKIACDSCADLLINTSNFILLFVYTNFESAQTAFSEPARGMVGNVVSSEKVLLHKRFQSMCWCQSAACSFQA